MLKRIPVEQLQVGMYIQELCGAWLDHPFWRTSFSIRTPEELRRVLESGVQEAWIDTARGIDVAGGRSRAETDCEIEQELARDDQPAPGSQRVPTEAEVAEARRICRRGRRFLIDLFRQARMGRALDAEEVLPLVKEIAGSVTRNPHVLINLARIRQRDDFTYMHSISVCALMVALARRLGHSAAEVHGAGLAGLLHDIGKVDVPLAILHKEGPLTEAEYEEMRRHSEAGHRLLAESRGMDDIVLDVCLHHHEKINGDGYPHGLEGAGISRQARMAAICDIYDATTSDRPYKSAWSAAKALRKMIEWTPGHLDTQIFHTFVRTVGIYPVGTLVRLKSDRLAVVVDQSESSLLAPRVKVFHSVAQGAALPHQMIDLSREGGETIVDYEEPATYGFGNLQHLWAGEGLGT